MQRDDRLGMSQSESFERPAFKAESPDDLRELITQAELIVANLRGAGSRTETLLFLLDAISGLVPPLQERGVDLRPELTRIETVERQLMAKDGVLVHELRRLGGLARAREVIKPAPAQWWWYLDARVAERQQRQLRKLLLVGGGVLAVFLAASLIYRFVFPPDPKRMAAMEKASQAEQALQTGDVATALTYYREAAEITPDDPEMLLWVGVLEEQLGHTEAAAQAYAAAEQRVGDQAHFLMQRGMDRLRLGNLDLAEADAKAALANKPDFAEGYFLLGNVYEARGQGPEAIAAFEKAADLAGQANNSPLVVMAKTRLAMLLQAAPMMQPQAPTATPSS